MEKKIKQSVIGLATLGATVGSVLVSQDIVKADILPTNQNSTQTQDEVPPENAKLNIESVTTSQDGNTKTTTTISTLDPKTNLSQKGQSESTLESAVKSASDASLTTRQIDTKLYYDVEPALKDYANQTKNINSKVDSYNKEVAEYNKQNENVQAQKNQAKEQLEDFQNDEDLDEVSQASKDGKITTTATVKENMELVNALAEASKDGLTINENPKQAVDSKDAALTDYKQQATNIEKITQDYLMYKEKLAQYEKDKERYDAIKQAYNDYIKEFNSNSAQKLIFDNQSNAVISKLVGVDTYITRDTANKLNSTDVISRFDKSKLDQDKGSSYTTENPYKNNEDVWVVLKKDKPVVVTYSGLSDASFNGTPIKEVSYTYTLKSSSDGTDEVMAQIMHDPTKTIWVGNNTTSPDNHLTIEVKILFLDENGNIIDISNGDAYLSLTSLNHYTKLHNINDEGVLGSEPINHLERVNIGNNEFIELPGSSVKKHEDNWVYSTEENQRTSDGAKFDAEDTVFYTNKQTGETFSFGVGTNLDKFFEVNGGKDNWMLVSQTQGWDNLPKDNKWPVNKYYGAGAVKLKDNVLVFDVSGNMPGLNTSYWFTINTATVAPQKPGEEPTKPTEPNKKINYHLNTISQEVEIPKSPEKPKVPNIEWHLAKIIVVKSETVPTPKTPDNPEPKTPDNPESKTPDNSKPKGESKSDFSNVNNTSKENTNLNKAEQLNVNSNRVLPQTGDNQKANNSSIFVAILLFISSAFGFLYRKKK